GDAVVLKGIALGLGLTAIVGGLTFLAHRHLPYRRMLALTRGRIAFALVVMVGEGAQTPRLAGWLRAAPPALTPPRRSACRQAPCPAVETGGAREIAVIAVVGSSLAAEHLRVRRPARQGHAAAQRPDAPPALESA